MLHPLSASQAGAANDTECAVRRVQPATYTLSLVAFKDQGDSDVQRLQAQRLSVQPCPGGGEGHLGVARSGINDGVAYLVIGKPKVFGRVKNVLPKHFSAGQRPAQQRVCASRFR